MSVAGTASDPAARAGQRPFPLHVGLATVRSVERLTPRMAPRRAPLSRSFPKAAGAFRPARPRSTGATTRSATTPTSAPNSG